MICFWYNVCDCHAIIKGNLLTMLYGTTRRQLRSKGGDAWHTVL